MSLRWSRYDLGIMAILLLGAVLLFAHLGDRALWDDEAQTAILGRQILKFGLPRFAPGENVATDRPDLSDYNSDKVFIWNTWLPYYLTAASFALLGESEFAARLPFAIFGFFSLLLYYRLAKNWFKRNHFWLLAALSFLIFSIPFLLHARQCRYYVLIIFGTLLMIDGYLSTLNNKKWGWAHLAAGGIFCFYSFYAIAGLNMAGIWLHALFRERHKKILFLLSFSTVIILIAARPSLWYMHLWNRPADHALTIFSFSRSIWVYLLWINGFIVPLLLPILMIIICRVKGWPWLTAAYGLFLLGASIGRELVSLLMLGGIGALLIVFIFFHLKKPRIATVVNLREDDSTRDFSKLSTLSACLVLVYILILSIVSPYPFFRYITPLIPLLALGGIAMIAHIITRKKYWGGAILALWLFTSILSALPLKIVDKIVSGETQSRPEYSVIPREIWRWTNIRFDMASYLYEISHNIMDPEKEIANYLKKNGTPGQTIKTAYGDISLMFYRPEMRIISRWDAGGGIPDYVIPRGPYPLLQSSQFLKAIGDTKYAEEKLPVADVVWSNNPDPLFHIYKMPENKPGLTIFRRVSY